MSETAKDFLTLLQSSWSWPILKNILQIMAIPVVGVILSWLIVVLFRRMEKLATASAALKRNRRREYHKSISTLLGITRTVSIALLWVSLLIVLLSQMGIDITPVLAGAGILGLAVGFGAQALVRDVISGVFHIMENQIRVGDIAKINGLGGMVVQITFRIIVLRDVSDVVHVIPHGKVETLSNLTKEQSAVVLDISVAYSHHPDRVIEALTDVGKQFQQDPDWGPRIIEPLEVMGVEDFADSGVVYRIRFRTLPMEQWNVGRQMRRRIKIEFDRRKIEFPFPHRTVYFSPDSAPLGIKMHPVSDAVSADTPKSAKVAARPRRRGRSPKT